MSKKHPKRTDPLAQPVAKSPRPQRRPVSRPVRAMLLAGALLAVGGSIVLADWWRTLPADREATYLGSQSCIDCHRDYYDQWKGSHHDLAMDLATPQTVLGDFENAEFEHHGIRSRMFRRDGRYYAHTEGPDGKLADFEIKYVFGVTPLQQYMVEFDRSAGMADGQVARLQVLRISWDTERKRWFYLPPPDVDEKLAPDDDLHWTGTAQRWNHMCADCHSTNLQKNFDDASGLYRTTFSEIDVGCEACHGPGSVHVELAERNSLFWDRERGFGLVSLSSSAQLQIDSCAPCHSRRRVVQPGFLPGDAYHDFYANELMEQATYFADGQILDEDYVYGSFLQSKMYHKGIRCTDCHDPHTARTRLEGNAVCTSCHQHPAGKYDSPSHHFHKPGSNGAACVECHMPETTYMEVDPRRDHSIRIPRPELSVDLGVPNACTRCHLDQDAAGVAGRDDLTQYLDWILAARDGDQQVKQELARVDAEMMEACREWYGDKPRGPRERPHFAYSLAKARRGEPEAEQDLAATATDPRLPAVIRATAMLELGRFDTREALDAVVEGLADSDPQVRAAAAGNLQGRLPPEELVGLLAPLLSDRVRLVRTEAARVLSTAPQDLLRRGQRDAFAAALHEFERGVMVSNDRGVSHLTLGIVHESLGDDQRALQAYRTAIRVEPNLSGPRSNLAAVYDRMSQAAQQRLRQASMLRQRQAAERAARDAERYRLDAEALRREELVQIERDAKLVPDAAGIQYRYGMLLYLHRRLEEAEQALLRASQLEPNNPQFLLGVVLYYQEMDRPSDALPRAERLLAMRPDNAVYRQIVEDLRAAMAVSGPGPNR